MTPDAEARQRPPGRVSPSTAVTIGPANSIGHRMAKRISIIGVGAAAQEFHLPAVKFLKHSLSVLVETNPQVLAVAARRWKPVRTAADLDSIDRSNTDLCIVCTPPDTHFATARSLMERGVSVLVEKPLVTRLDEFNVLAALDAAGGARCFVGQMRRFFPNVRLLERVIRSNIFGRIRSVKISEGIPATWQSKSDYATDPGDEGVVTNTGAHTFDLVTHLFDPAMDRLIVEECLTDRYPQTNNLYFSAHDVTNDVRYEVKISRDTKVANRIAVFTDMAVILTNSLFDEEPLMVFAKAPDAALLYITGEMARYNLRYTFALQLESVLDALSDPDPATSPVHISRVRSTVAFFELVKQHNTERPFEWGFAA